MICLTRFGGSVLSFSAFWPRRSLNSYTAPIPHHQNGRADPEFIPLLPEGTNKRSFMKRPTDIQGRQRFINLKKDIVM
jgi:hypothetical protein